MNILIGFEMITMVAVNEYGMRIGQDHQKAILTDRDVELMRQLHDGGMSLSRLAIKFECSKTEVWNICNYKCRNQITNKFKEIRYG